jgi:hypothetical protein
MEPPGQDWEAPNLVWEAKRAAGINRKSRQCILQETTAPMPSVVTKQILELAINALFFVVLALITELLVCDVDDAEETT